MSVAYPPPKDVFVGEGTFPTSLSLKELSILQEKTKVGPYVLMHRIHRNEWSAGDIYETIRLGLCGGGMAHQTAQALVDNYLPGRWLEYAPTATAILFNALKRPEEDVTEGEPKAPTTETSTPEGSSPGPMSSGSPEPQDDRSPT